MGDKIRLGGGWHIVDGHVVASDDECHIALVLEDSDDNVVTVECIVGFDLMHYFLVATCPFRDGATAAQGQYGIFVARGMGDIKLDQGHGPLLTVCSSDDFIGRDVDQPGYPARFQEALDGNIKQLLIDAEMEFSEAAVAKFASFVVYGFIGFREKRKSPVRDEGVPTWREWKKEDSFRTAVEFARKFYEGKTQKYLRQRDIDGYRAFHERCRYEGLEPSSVLPKGISELEETLRKNGGVIPNPAELRKSGVARNSAAYLEARRAKWAAAKRVQRGG